MAKEKDDELLIEIRERWTVYQQFWKPIYDPGDDDAECLYGKHGPWPKEAVAEREAKKRPICHLDICKQFIRRIVNQARINPRGIVITPKGSDATDETAEMREDRIRQIDYESLAPQARINAMQNAVERGIGFYMVTTDWERHDSFNQKIGTRQIPNPKSVLIDPFCEQPDFSDMSGAFVITKYEDKKYKKKFPKAKDRSFAEEYLQMAPGWMDEKTIQVCEYWCVKTKERTKLLLETPEGPQELWLDEIPDAEIDDDVLNAGGMQFRILKQREAEIPSVHQYITNGLEILKRKSWMGSTIPIITITGLRTYVNGKLVIESATRGMAPGQLMYDYMWTKMQEMFGMMPNSHWKAIVGQTEDFPEWDDANRDPVTVLRYRAKTTETGEQILNSPERVDYTPRIEAFLNALTFAVQAVQQAAGMFSVDRQDRVRSSGKAQEVQNETQDIGNYHFSDYLDLAVQYEGRIKNELLRHIEDTKAMRGFRKEDDKYERKEVVPMANPETGEVEQHPYGKGRDHDVIVKAGPSMQSQFDKAADFLDILAQNPQYGPLVMDLVVHMKQLGPLGKKLAERFEKMLPPNLQQTEDGQPDPAQQLQVKTQEVEQLKQAFDVVHAKLEEAQKKIDAKVIESDAKLQISQADNATKLAIAEMGAAVKQNSEATAAFMAKMDSTLQILMQDKQQSFDAASQLSTQQHATDTQSADQMHQAGMQSEQLGSQERMTAAQLAAQAQKPQPSQP